MFIGITITVPVITNYKQLSAIVGVVFGVSACGAYLNNNNIIIIVVVHKIIVYGFSR